MSLFAGDLFNLEGAVALVTGGGTGIGLMAAKALAANGAKVYITGRRAGVLEEAIKAHGAHLKGSLVAVQADVSSKADLKRVLGEIKEGVLHILVNNAGIEGPVTKLDDNVQSGYDLSRRHIENEDFPDWGRVFQINTHSIFFATMTLLPLLEAGNKKPPPKTANWTASVINITSISGQVRLSQSHYAYNASKAAANHLSSMLAHELNFDRKIGVRVNALAPGLFATEMTSKKPSNAGVSSPDDLVGFANPAGRTGTEAEMANAVLLFSTNTFVNGQTLAVDGGFVTA
ncbi:NAD(P)-binding protein [Acaromyces ingoldii]|uniref:NAD(P)-binding protein n=1 Tax=Acaromyces ingoldii TaxID=215250 RepID=A0A316YMF6_9BASI|nr:NAD(P)-binding protein [Acaromyces ingoldii]PWN89253.1 NAD(P)-binding protein [Acaromyces ingoldii]